MAAMNNDLSAAEAASLLNVSLPTLYSYVSRGLLASVSNGQSRRKRYLQEDVLRLAARKNDAKRGGQTAVAAMHWGLPVLETRISHILDGRLLYRGCDAPACCGTMVRVTIFSRTRLPCRRDCPARRRRRRWRAPCSPWPC